MEQTPPDTPTPLKQTTTKSSWSSTRTESTTPTELSLQRQDTHESTLLQHLELDEEEENAWKAVATPPRKQPPRTMQPISLPASCFPSLKGKIPTPISTPTLEIQNKIHSITRSQFTEEEQRLRYSAYVDDKDFEMPKGGWMDRFRHGHSNSISDVFNFNKMRSKGHKPTKSASAIE